MSAFIITRIQTGDYDRWRPLFDQDRPRAERRRSSSVSFEAQMIPTRYSSTLSTRVSTMRTRRASAYCRRAF